ncbi:MAG: folylpolyglutamate synthase/dihydrofolate synthase family protein [Vicinamibacterales bacterium]
MSVRERLAALETSGIKLGLANIERISAALGDPHRAFTTVHVAGTNGKGSVVAMVHAALRAAGVSAGRYTSPHLSSIHERFVIDNRPVEPAVFDRAATGVLDVIDRLVADGRLSGPPTWFEATTAIAFVLFREAGLRVAVVEVGLGGRFDSTNVVVPAVTAITSIAMDHEQFLGRTRAAVAYEKAGIIKPGVPVVIGRLPADADAVVRAVAAGAGARVVDAADPGDRLLPTDAGHAGFVPADGALAGEPIRVGLPGDHQAGNAQVAYRVLDLLGACAGIEVPPAAIRQGLAHTHWPGRLELLHLAGGRRLLLDAAHNPHGAAALASYLDRWYAPRPALVFAAMQDKDLRGMLARLLPAVGRVILPPMATPRGATPDAVASAIRALDATRDTAVADSVPHALELAWAHDRDVVAAGSIVLLGEVRDALNPRDTLV